MRLGSKLMFIIACLLVSSCATSKRSLLSAPVATPPPVHDTGSLGHNIDDLDNALKKASSQVDRIKILIDSIPEN